jgi:hypothetical protein
MKKTAKGIFSLMLAVALALALQAPAYAAGSGEAETKAAALRQLGLFKACPTPILR